MMAATNKNAPPTAVILPVLATNSINAVLTTSPAAGTKWVITKSWITSPAFAKRAKEERIDSKTVNMGTIDSKVI
ncbi:Uncharacterised protein [Vibrio cholerae]|uniref:Uncharacterized protein n=1 Tax=Vibrio cholerae TaxID=666 RepID=A0A655TD01_VIBCL|nr:Uncharacterised protein [Vibrio cholerae]CSA44068.1 Uncharacterised protein [Vibrio cholerae]CSA44567.1 Uncharacterised protein [Vibrio cholerae]CSB34098.1 Uncharacterised protein [Vibrio cholerae]